MEEYQLYCTLKVNDKQGKLLEIADACVNIDVKPTDEVLEQYEPVILEAMEKFLKNDYKGKQELVYRLEMLYLEDDLDEDEEEEDDEEIGAPYIVEVIVA